MTRINDTLATASRQTRQLREPLPALSDMQASICSRANSVRLFLTCCLIYTLHFSSNTVREIYPALALGDHFSFRVDEYAHMHPDLFEKPGYGWHIGNNPGASMLAAIPYAMARPIIDPLVHHVQQARNANKQLEPPKYDSPWPMAQEFYRESWRRGFDIKFGLGALVMQAFCMAPVSALGVVVMFHLLGILFQSEKTALWLSLLYAFGTPVFFRTGYLNHNMMLGHFAFMGFVCMWNPGHSQRWSSAMRFFLGGLAGGTAILFDYSGIVLLMGMFIYGLVKRFSDGSVRDAVVHGWWYFVGTLGPVGLLWLYQYQAFGNAILPGQHWMPPVEWIEQGYQGYRLLPYADILVSLLVDYRYGFFTSAPILLLAIGTPLVWNRLKGIVPQLELATMLALFAGFWLFFGGNNYTRLQFNTGIRYMSAMFPFMFVPAALVLVRLPRIAVYFISLICVTESWSLAMHRDVERGLGLLDPMVHVFFGGFELPLLTAVSRIGAYTEFFPRGPSPIPLFILTAAIIYGIWAPHRLRRDL